MILFKILYLVLLFSAQIASLIICRKKSNYFVFYVFFGLLYEIIFNCFDNYKIQTRYFYDILSIIYFGYFYLKNTVNKVINNIILGLLIVILLYSLYILFKSQLIEYNQIMMLLMCVYNIVLSLLYFIDMIIQPRDIPLRYEFPFWVSSGLLLWSSMLIFNIGAIYYLNKADVVFLKKLQSSFYIVNIVVYSLYLYGLAQLYIEHRDRKG